MGGNNSKARKKMRMGLPTEESKVEKTKPQEPVNYLSIEDKFDTFKQVEMALRKGGLEVCQLIVGIDFTGSNKKQGGYPYYDHDNLHHVSKNADQNPYEQVLSIICKTLSGFDSDGWIDTYGFGDEKTEDKHVFPFCTVPDQFGGLQEAPCQRLEGVLQRYKEIASSVVLSGPTSFEPIIRKAVELVKERKSYHILLIICDGAVNSKEETIEAIVEASKYPLSIICIGVGKGPWGLMEHFDDEIEGRKFDNFQFVHFHGVATGNFENMGAEFARRAMMEIPVQHEYIRKHMGVM